MDTFKLYLKDIGDTKSTHEDNMILYHKWKGGDMQSYNKLVKNFLYLVISIAKKYKSSKSPLDELICEGNINLLLGLDKYDHVKGSLAPYLATWISAGIIRSLKNNNGSIHIPENVINMGTFKLRYHYLDEVKEKEDGIKFELEDKVEETCDELEVKAYLNTLNERDRNIIELAFGIGHVKQYTVNEIIEILQISSVTIRNRFKAITGLTITNIQDKIMNFDRIDNHSNTIQIWLDEHLEFQDKVIYDVISRGTNLHLSVIKKSITEDQKLRIKLHNKSV